MKEAIGSSWLIYLIIIFLIIYVFFMAFVMNYAAAYRAVNYVITQIENCQGQMDNCGDVNWKVINNTIQKEYRYFDPNSKSDDAISQRVKCIDNGTGVVYRVTLPVEFDLPLLGGLRWVSVKAETKTIRNASC